MTINYPGPLVADITYTYSGITHHQQLNFSSIVSPYAGQSLAEISATQRNATEVNIVTAVTAWITLIKPMFNAAVKFDSMTVWKYTPYTNDRLFINAQTLDIDGTSGSAAQPAGQLILTFRTAIGGVMKLSFMESSAVPGPSVSRAGYTGTPLAISSFVEGTTNWILGRDNGYPIAGIAQHPGQNEALFKRRYRSL